MGAEVGATTSVFPYDEKMAVYLAATGRQAVVDALAPIASELCADSEVLQNPDRYYDRVIEIDLSTLEPHVNGPYTPDRAWPVSQLAKAAAENDWPQTLSVGLIGSCTNSSYEDLDRAASVAKQATNKHLRVHSEFTITPGSEMIRATVERDGQLKAFEEMGGLVLANACGPCIGQWARHNAKKQEKNAIITSFNRNFAKRNDGNPNTYAFVGSPEIVTAYAIAGTLRFNPLTDTLLNEEGLPVKLDPPTGYELPPGGFTDHDNGYQAPAKNGAVIEIQVDPKSERLQLLEPFTPWDGKDLTGLRLLVKVKGKCTTDHISPAGSWLAYRGHLQNISKNVMSGAVNAFNDQANMVKNPLTGYDAPIYTVVEDYKKHGIWSIIVGDENYGEGSSREHAAMEPRYMGVRAIIVKSFARIHESNLKKQGMLALTFADKADYNRIQEADTFDITGLTDFAPERPLTMVAHHANGQTESITLNHTYNAQQIAWFKAGSALNLIKSQLRH